jgi:hypothetical protein
MKAQKAVSGFFAGLIVSATLLSRMGSVISASGADQPETPEYVGLTVERTGANMKGKFRAVVNFDAMPQSGLAAVDFAIAYDPAAISISDVTLLCDTGAEEAEAAMDPKLKGTVFTYEIAEGEIRIRWATVLDREYWLKETGAFISISGKLDTEKVEGGTYTELRIVPAHREGAGEKPVVTAGYMDGEGTPHTYETKLTDGVIWMPVVDGITKYYDVDLDGKVSVSDAVLLMRAVTEDKALCAAAYANADCDFDSELTIADVTLILEAVIRLKETEAQENRQ